MQVASSFSPPLTRVAPRVRVPVYLPLPRAWRWCLLATIRDQRLAARRGRAISFPNLRRLLLRRWAEVCVANDLSPDDATIRKLRDRCCEALATQAANCSERCT